jgi:antitoxin ParD1/3/4
MAGDTSISRDAHSTGPISRQMACGRDRSPSEMVSAGLRPAEDKEPPQLDGIRAALLTGEASGEVGPFDLEVFVAGKRA